MSDIYTTLVSKIIKDQEEVIGPLAWSEANKVNGIQVTDHKVIVKGEGKAVLESLVNQYSTLFGRASIEVCKDAIKSHVSDLDKTQLPEILIS